MAREVSEAVKITKSAASYLHKKGKINLVIEYPEYRTNCECAFVQVPEVLAKKPKVEENYIKAEIEGINVFLSRQVSLPTDSDVVIDLDSFLGIKNLSLSGFKSED
ncbi:MAG: CC/Se motif family (seleno)protein [Sedimentibacter sp.]|uniref:CC/Se motif family (seleno)protein n=1 Tax=Sedimentibacter sp. TaxID=1960295 RepID=UPI00315976AE